MEKRKNLIKINDLLESIGDASKVLGKRDRYVSTVSPIDEAKSESVTFCNRKAPEGLQMVRNSEAGVVICCDNLPLTEDDLKDKTLILVRNPRLAFIRVMRKHFVEATVEYGISPSAVIDEDAKIHPSVHIGPNSYIGKCEIGANTVIYGNAHVHSGVVIGENVLIQAGVVIGAESLGLERNEKGEYERFPQIGSTMIEDDVEIGSTCTIHRGAMRDTVIGQGTKIGHNCTVCHEAVIGKHCLINAHTVLGGSARVGDYSTIHFSACIRNGIKIGKNAVVGMGSVVTKNVGDGKVVFGVPAKERDDT